MAGQESNLFFLSWGQNKLSACSSCMPAYLPLWNTDLMFIFYLFAIHVTYAAECGNISPRWKQNRSHGRQDYCQNRPPPTRGSSRSRFISQSTGAASPAFSPASPSLLFTSSSISLHPDWRIIGTLTRGSTRQPEDLLLEIEPETKRLFLSPTPNSSPM